MPKFGESAGGGGVLDDGRERYVDVQLSHDDLIHLHAVGQVLVPVVADRIVVPTLVYFLSDTAAGAYTLPSGAKLSISGTYLDVAFDPSGFLLDTGDVIGAYAQAFNSPTVVNTATPDDPITIQLTDCIAELTDGNAANTLSIRTFYRVVPAVAFGA